MPVQLRRNLLIGGLAAIAVIVAPLVLANIGANEPCPINLRIAGCLLERYQGLAGGLIGGLFTLIAAIIAWFAVQAQIYAAKALALQDRTEAERVLKQQLNEAAEALGALWRLIEEDQNRPTPSLTAERIQSATEMALRSVATVDALALYRAMAATLSWEKRLNFTRLIDELEGVRHLVDASKLDGTDELRAHISFMSWSFELCVPETEEHFRGLFRRAPKAYTAESWIRYAAGLEP